MTQSELAELLKKESLEFIRGHIDDDPELLALRFRGYGTLPIRAIAEQIRCIKKAGSKLPELSSHPLLYEKTALEQASSEYTARLKTKLYKGDKLIDLTGGLGIDDIFFSGSFKEVIYCERNPLLSEIFRHNLNLLEIKNISVNEGDSIEILKSFPDNYFSLIYADPARRDENRRFIGLKNCSPDVVEAMPLMLRKSEKILIKASPAIEIEEIKRQFTNLGEFTVVSVDNECREVLLRFDSHIKETGEIVINSVMIDSSSNTERTFTGSDLLKSEKKVTPEVLQWFYEPDSAIIKSRLTAKLAEEFSLRFINKSVDFLTSGELRSDFPGRVFEVRKVLPYKVKEITHYLKSEGITSANLSRRDFPDAPERIRKLLKLKDGGMDYLFFTKDTSARPIAIFCKKYKQKTGE
ncbi:MAG: THUMP-like domain-containing protein [Acidobacteriota bacterium]